MNRQDKNNGGRGIEWTQPYGIPGYTWNPVKGCTHACEWRMPNGAIAECYAKAVAENLARVAYPKGFASLAFDPDELMRPYSLKEPSGIFADSMSDLVGAGVDETWIKQVIQVMRETPQHIYFILTKNPPRLKEFQWPENVWVGVSAPPTFMFGKELSREQQERWYRKALATLGEIDVPVRWTSIEPLSWDVSPLIEEFWPNLDWAVIGAASNGKLTYQPDTRVFKRTFEALGGLPLFLKGNIDHELACQVCGKWCEEFPLPLPSWREMRKAAGQ